MAEPFFSFPSLFKGSVTGSFLLVSESMPGKRNLSFSFLCFWKFESERREGTGRKRLNKRGKGICLSEQEPTENALEWTRGVVWGVPVRLKLGPS